MENLSNLKEVINEIRNVLDSLTRIVTAMETKYSVNLGGPTVNGIESKEIILGTPIPESENSREEKLQPEIQKTIIHREEPKPQRVDISSEKGGFEGFIGKIPKGEEW